MTANLPQQQQQQQSRSSFDATANTTPSSSIFPTRSRSNSRNDEDSFRYRSNSDVSTGSHKSANSTAKGSKKTKNLNTNNNNNNNNPNSLSSSLVEELLELVLRIKETNNRSGQSFLHSSSCHANAQQQEKNLGMIQTMLDRVKQMDEYNTIHTSHKNAQQPWQYQFLTQTDTESGYTPLHSAIYHKNLLLLLLLLRQAINSETITSTTASIAWLSSSSRTKAHPKTETQLQSLQQHYRFLQHPMQILQQPLQQPQATSTTTTTSTSCAIVSVLDNEGMTPLQLLQQIQSNELTKCRLSLHVSSSTEQNQNQQPSTIRFYDPDLDEVVVLDEQNEWDLLSRGLYNLPREEGDDDDDDDDDDEDDDDDNDSHTSHSTTNHTSNCSDTTMYACEVCTFGKANHIALGVLEDSSKDTTADTTITSSTTANFIRPQRVQDFAQDIIGRNNTAIAIAAASHHTLVVTKLGHLYAFGLGKGGRLGLGNENHFPTPTRIVGGYTSGGGGLSSSLFLKKKVVSIAAAENHSLCVTSTGEVYGWGSNRFGQLGIHTSSSSAGAGGGATLKHNKTSPKKKKNTTQGVSNTNNNNNNHNAGVSSSTIRCWPCKIEDLKHVICTQVAAGTKHSVAVSQMGEVYVWGDNTSGQLGTSYRRGSSNIAPTTTALAGTTITKGGSSSMSSSSNSSNSGSFHKVHRVQALWGGDTNHHTNTSNNSRTHVMNRKIAIDIAASEFSTLVLTKPTTALPVNSVYEWGHGNHVPRRVNFESNKNNNKTKNNNNNKNKNNVSYNNWDIQNHHRFVNPISITCAKYHNAAITSDGHVYTWGLHAEPLGCSSSSSSSSLGTAKTKKNNNHNITSPQLVTGMLPENTGNKDGLAVAIAACENHTAVVTNCGSLYTWGATYGKDVLGHIGVRYQPKPKKVPGVYRVVDVAVAKEHTVLLIGATFPPINQFIPTTLPTFPSRSTSFRSSGSCSSSSGSNNLTSLELLAARKIAEHVDLYNVIPVLITAERCQCSFLIEYCTEFVCHNLDGVLNVSRKTEMDCYLNEKLNDCYYYNDNNYNHNNNSTSGGKSAMDHHHNGNNPNSSAPAYFYNWSSSNEEEDGIDYHGKDHSLYHPLIQKIILAGSIGNEDDCDNNTSTTSKKQQLVDFVSWVKACEKLTQTDLVVAIKRRQQQRETLALESPSSSSGILSPSKKKKNMMMIASRGRSVSFAEETMKTKSKCSELCILLTSNMDLSTKEFAVAKYDVLSKEIRGLRKRLNQIAKLLDSSSPTSPPTVTPKGNADAANAPAAVSTVASASIASSSSGNDDVSLFTPEQQEKIARRPQLQADLMILEPALERVQQKIREFDLAEKTTTKTPTIPLDKNIEKQTSSSTETVKELKSDCNELSMEKKAEKSNNDTAPESIKTTATTLFRCKVCSITCPDEKSYTLHINGRKHRNRVVQVTEEEKKQAAASMMQERLRQKVAEEDPTSLSLAPRPMKTPPPKSPWKKNTSGPSGNENTCSKSDNKIPRPRYSLPPPTVPVSDVLAKVEGKKTDISNNDIKNKSNAISFREILEEEAKKASVPKISKKKHKAIVVSSAAPGSQNVQMLKLPPGSAPTLKSPPWATPTPKIPTSLHGGVLTANVIGSTDSSSSLLSANATAITSQHSPATSNRKYSLGDFLEVEKQQQHFPIKKKWALGNSAAAGPGLKDPWSASPSQMASPAPPTSPFSTPKTPIQSIDYPYAGDGRAMAASPSVALVPSPAPTKPIVSLRDIQEEEEDFKNKQDQSFGVVNGKWFIERRERADSLHAIQENAESEKEYQMMVEEQIRIEEQIRRDLALQKQKEEEKKKKPKPKKKKNNKQKKFQNADGTEEKEEFDRKNKNNNRNHARGGGNVGGGGRGGKQNRRHNNHSTDGSTAVNQNETSGDNTNRSNTGSGNNDNNSRNKPRSRANVGPKKGSQAPGKPTQTNEKRGGDGD